jgi:hypothetical protein
LGKRKNGNEGGFGRVFIGSRRVVVGRAVQNGGRDVEFVVAVAPSRAPRDEDEDVELPFILILRNGKWAGLGCIARSRWWTPAGLLQLARSG